MHLKTQLKKMGSKGMAFFLLLLTGLYRMAFRPWISGGCRFSPSCWTYMTHCFGVHPFGKALLLTIRRIGRCHPWGSVGCDPVPAPSLSRISWKNTKKI